MELLEEVGKWNYVPAEVANGDCLCGEMLQRPLVRQETAAGKQEEELARERNREQSEGLLKDKLRQANRKRKESQGDILVLEPSRG